MFWFNYVAPEPCLASAIYREFMWMCYADFRGEHRAFLSYCIDEFFALWVRHSGPRESITKAWIPLQHIAPKKKAASHRLSDTPPKLSLILREHAVCYPPHKYNRMKSFIHQTSGQNAPHKQLWEKHQPRVQRHRPRFCLPSQQNSSLSSPKSKQLLQKRKAKGPCNSYPSTKMTTSVE